MLYVNIKIIKRNLIKIRNTYLIIEINKLTINKKLVMIKKYNMDYLQKNKIAIINIQHNHSLKFKLINKQPSKYDDVKLKF